MINNQLLLKKLKCLPEVTPRDLMSFLLFTFKSVNSMKDVARFNSYALDVSDCKEAIAEFNSLRIAEYDYWKTLVFNTSLTDMTKLELIFYKNKLVQGGVQFIFDKRLLQTFNEIYDYYKTAIESNFLIEEVGTNQALFNRMFNIYDIPPNTPQNKIDLLRKIFRLTGPEQQIEILKYVSQRAAEGEFLSPEDLALHNSLQGYMSVVSPGLSQVSSFNLRIADNKWCDLAYV